MKNGAKQIKLEIKQKEYDGESHNVIAELPGKRDEWIVLSAHYDTTSLSHGAYDNMSGCAALHRTPSVPRRQLPHGGLSGQYPSVDNTYCHTGKEWLLPLLSSDPDR